MNISPMTFAATVAPTAAPGPAESGDGTFGKLVTQHLQQINQTQVDADSAIQQLVTGEADDIQDVVLSMAKADLTFRLVLEIRNRLIESYQEIMRMQV